MDLLINGRSHAVPTEAVDPAMPLLWVLRDVLALTGTKYGCGVGGLWGLHGAPGRRGRALAASRPCRPWPGGSITTIEGLGAEAAPHPLQRAWELHQVPQCGYCQSGMLMAAAASAQAQPQAQRCRHRRGHHQPVPLRHLSPGAGSHPCRGRHDAR